MKLTFELVTMCRYCALKDIETEATVNRHGYDLCVPCRDASVKAEVESDMQAEAYYRNRS